MPLSVSAAAQLRSIDRQIVDLLRERTVLCREALDGDGSALDSEMQMETIGEWQEAADEKGLSLSAMTAICKGILRLYRGEE